MLNISQQNPSLNRPDDPFKAPRLQMMNQQIRSRNIVDPRVLNAIATIPRHQFVKPCLADLAYCDRPLPIGYGQTISQPYIVAYMTQAARITPEAIALEIGTGCGYQTALLGNLAKTVYSVERIPELAKQAHKTLHHLGYRHIHIKIGDGYQGWPSHAPYDAIIVTAAPKQIPKTLIEQLAMNGRLVIPVGDWRQTIWVITKTPTGIVKENTIPVQFVPMIETFRRSSHS